MRAIARNPTIRTLWPPSTPLSPPTACTVAGRPIANLSFAVNYALAPPDARDVFAPVAGRPDDFLRNVWGYHFLNLVVHLAAALALFGVVRRTLATDRLRPLFGDASTWLASAVALVWVVHPLQTAAVTYVVQRVESLMGLFYLLTLYCAIRASEGVRARGWSVTAVAACALGMATKEVMITAPIIVWLWERTFLQRDRRQWALLLALAATSVILVGLVAHEHRDPSIDMGAGIAWQYLITQAGVIVHYVRLVVVPAPLVFLYTWPLAASLGAVAPQAVLLAALVLLTVVGAVRNHPLAFAGGWFFLILAPSSSVLPIVTEVAAEQRMYLPLAAVLACAATAVFLAGRQCVSWLARDPRTRTRLALGATGALMVPLVVALGIATRGRNRDYWTEAGLWQQTVSAQPDNQRARLAYGVALMSLRRFADAEGQLQMVADAAPADSLAQSRLGAAQAAQGKLDSAIAHFERAVTLRPDDVDAQRWLGQAYAARRSDALAVAHFDRALAVQRDDVGLLVEMAGILADSRDPAVRDGARAVRLAERAAGLTSRADPRVLDVLAVAQAASGRFSEAASTADEALKLARLSGNQALASELEYRARAYSAMAAGR